MADEILIRASLRDELTRPIRRVREEVDRTSTSLRRLAVTGTGRAGAALIKMTGSTNGVSGALRKVDGQLRSVSRSLGTTFATNARRGALALGALAAASTALGVNTAADFQTAEVALRRLTGSAAAGAELFEFLTDLDPVRPFDIGQLNQTATQLAAVNIKGQQLKDMIAGVTDVAAATADPSGSLYSATKAISQMSSAGVILAEELNQLIDAGVNVGPALQKAFGMGIAEAKKANASGAGLAAQPFIDALFAGASGAGEEIATETFRGLLSGVKSRGMLQLVEAFNPLLGILQQQLPALETAFGGFVGTFGPALSGFVGQLVPLIAGALTTFGPVLGAIFTGLGQLLGAAAPAFALLDPVIDDLVVALGVLVTELVPVMPELVRLFVALVGVLPAFVRLLADLVPLVTPMAAMATALLSFGPAPQIMAGLLTALLGYRALAGLVGTLHAFAGGLTAITAAQTGGALAGAGARGGAVAAAGAPVAGRALGGAARFLPQVAAVGAGFMVGTEVARRTDGFGLGDNARNLGRSLGFRDDTEESFQRRRAFTESGGRAGVAARNEATLAAYEARAGAQINTNIASGAIVVYPTPGMDEQRLAAMIPPEIERYDRERGERG